MLKPPWKASGRLIESMIRKSLHCTPMLEEGVPIGIALSGGKDSLTLLAMLNNIRGRGFPNFPLVALHVSGQFSCGAGLTTRYLENVCRELEVPLIVRSVDQEIERLECYSCSRIRRRELFEAAKGEGVSTIAFGHHRDDQAQTAMMNLLSKGEFEGMLSKIEMYAYGVTLIRPLLDVPEQAIISFAQQQGFLRAMCRCPVGQNSMRKQVEGLLKNAEGLFPHAKKNIARAVDRYGTKKAARDPRGGRVEGVELANGEER